MQTRTLAGRYEIQSVLGRGGMAVVWHGADLELGREVAIKTVELSGDAPAGAAERFRREARTTAALSQPNIVTIFDTGVDGDTAFLVMELLPGPTLAERLKRSGPLPVADVVDTARQVCAALEVAHAAGVIHRDIKPDNLAYAADGSVKVLDFGITRILDEITGSHASTVTAAGTVLGTVAYLSPEQASDSPIDGRADLYALGCVMTALLTGSPPFTGASPMAVMVQHLHDTPPSVTAARPDVPGELSVLIAELLAKNPAQRPASASDVVARLDAMPSGEEPTAVL
ncbi:MAG: serine/threonine protein kinase, partial [Actinomycetota bacterium]|nr:serine/threonine protein kinase [Actinomycetota bacterium]